jgi:RNA polymerase sigma factor (TIGR02999 family)
MADVTQILTAIAAGDPKAAAELLPLVYDELRKLAAARLADEKPGQTLQATALVHEAYLRLVGDHHFSGRGHFFGAAAEAMRRILVEQARRKATEKHGGGRHRVALPEHLPASRPDSDVLAVDEALDRLAAEDPPVAELVKLHVFAGMTIDEAAVVIGISPRTAYRNWQFARAWLFRRVGGEPAGG